MEEDQLKLLETRISKAIAFIEKVKTREKLLVQEKEELKEEVASLESTVEQREKKIEELKESQKYLKDKIESILTKLENLEGLDTQIEHQLASKSEANKGKESAGEEGSEDSSEDLIIEENIVDLKKEYTEEETLEEAQKSDDEGKERKKNQPGESKDPVPILDEENTIPFQENDEDAESLFRINEDLEVKNSVNVSGTKASWFENNPFIDT